jgi:hypothetical protein
LPINGLGEGFVGWHSISYLSNYQLVHKKHSLHSGFDILSAGKKSENSCSNSRKRIKNCVNIFDLQMRSKFGYEITLVDQTLNKLQNKSFFLSLKKKC